MKKTLIEKIVNELKNEGYDVEGFICEEGVMSSDYGLVEYEFFDGIEDDEIKDYLIDYLEEQQGNVLNRFHIVVVNGSGLQRM